MILFRWLQNIFATFIGQEWGTALHVWFAFAWTIPLEIFLQKSGRFDWSKTGQAVSAREPDQTRCPFLGAMTGMCDPDSSDGSHSPELECRDNSDGARL